MGKTISKKNKKHKYLWQCVKTQLGTPVVFTSKFSWDLFMDVHPTQNGMY